jgi:hypothetical protein
VRTPASTRQRDWVRVVVVTANRFNGNPDATAIGNVAACRLRLPVSDLNAKRFWPLLVAAVAGLIASSSSQGRASWIATSSESSSEATRIPLLVPAPYLSIDFDLPPAVKERLVRVNKELADRARAAAQLPATAANGCEPSGFGLGAPAPRIDVARIIGHHVEVVFNFVRMPSSPACRPWELAVVVYSGSRASSTFKNFVQRSWLGGRRGRVVLDLPWRGQAPYHVIVSAVTINGRRGRAVESLLRCPGTRSAVRGCLPGYQPSLHAYPMPKPVLPKRGLDRSALEASLAYALAGERQPPIVHAVPRASRCPSLNVCVLTYVDPAFPDSPYGVRYRIAGQQLPGCWMGMRSGPLDPLPFNDAYTGHLELAACASWLR